MGRLVVLEVRAGPKGRGLVGRRAAQERESVGLAAVPGVSVTGPPDRLLTDVCAGAWRL